MPAFIYMRRTRCTVQLFASDKIMRPGGSVPFLKASHEHARQSQDIITAIMSTLREFRGSKMTLQEAYGMTLREHGASHPMFANVKFVPESYTNSGSVFARATVQIGA